MNNPKISVIIPVYNVEKYLSECLDSVVNQTLRDIEIICVNDGSTDSSLQILKEYASKDKRIKIIDKENEGLGYTRKAGLKIASGEYILFLDSDDKYDSNHSCENLYNCIKKHDADILIFSISNYHNGNQKKWDLKIDKLENVDRLLTFKEFSIYILNGCFSACNKLYSKKFLDSYDDWFFPKKIYYEDMPFHVQIMTRTEKICFIDNATYLYRVNPSSITRVSSLDRDKKKVESLFFVIDKILNILIEKKLLNELEKEFVCFFILYAFSIFSMINVNITNFGLIINKFKEIINKFPDVDVDELYHNKNSELHLVKEQFIFYKLMKSLSTENMLLYMIKKKYFIQIKQRKNYGHHSNILDIKNYEIQFIKKSWSYRIGRLFTYPFSILLDFYRFIRDYNLIKKSDLFDSEYYLKKNEDVKKAKIDPIKHYLKFGWKEGRNPSAEFDNNEYLNKRPDVRVANICPLVHYLKFGKEDKIIVVDLKNIGQN